MEDNSNNNNNLRNKRKAGRPKGSLNKKGKALLKDIKDTPITKEVISRSKDDVSTKAEVNNRINEIANLLSVGYTRSYILSYGSKWSISDRQIDNYISEAWKKLKEINDLSIQDNLSMVTNQLWDLYRDSRANNDRQNANKALAQIAKIKGLEVNTVNHIIEDQRELSNMTNEQLDELLNDSNELQ